jgi:murein L,D-transpeptidase YafK
MKHTFFAVLCLLTGLLIFACSQGGDVKSHANEVNMSTTRNAFPELPLADLMSAAGLQSGDVWIYIDKSDMQLLIKHDTTTIKTYPVVLGGNPVGDKRMEGDQKTPEGEFALRSLYPHKKWSKFLWVNYPTDESWDKFNKAKAAGEIPKNASIGGEIGIHGVPEGYDALIDEMQNWTLGCISLKNAHVDEIFDAVKVGTKVVIVA